MYWYIRLSITKTESLWNRSSQDLFDEQALIQHYLILKCCGTYWTQKVRPWLTSYILIAVVSDKCCQLVQLIFTLMVESHSQGVIGLVLTSIIVSIACYLMDSYMVLFDIISRWKLILFFRTVSWFNYNYLRVKNWVNLAGCENNWVDKLVTLQYYFVYKNVWLLIDNTHKMVRYLLINTRN